VFEKEDDSGDFSMLLAVVLLHVAIIVWVDLDAGLLIERMQEHY
jgi:hypothetical protein